LFTLGVLLALAPLLTGCLGGLRRGAVEYGGGSIAYSVQGRGPAVVLLHGGQLDSRMWDEEAGILADGYRVVTVDARGFGRSSDITGPFRHHDDLRAVVEELGLSEFVLVGHSLGGRVALDFALAYPGRVKGLVLLGPGMSGWQWSRSDAEAFGRIQAAAQRGDLAGATELWLAHPYMAPSMEYPERAAEIRALALDNARCWLQPHVEQVAEPPARARLGEVQAPTLIIVGERDVPDIQNIVTELKLHIPDVRVKRIQRAGHMLTYDAPWEVCQDIRGFLAEVLRH